MELKGQGAIEYLLIIGAAILVVAIVIVAVTGVLGTTQDRGKQASEDQLKAQEKMDTTGPTIGFNTNVYAYCSTSGPHLNIANFDASSGFVTVSDALSDLNACVSTVATGSSRLPSKTIPLHGRVWTNTVVYSFSPGGADINPTGRTNDSFYNLY